MGSRLKVDISSEGLHKVDTLSDGLHKVDTLVYGLKRPVEASSGGGKEGVDFGLLRLVLLSLGVVPGPLSGVKLRDLAVPDLFRSRIQLRKNC